MAILDGVKNAVAANTARAANNVAVNGLHSLVGDVFGVDLSTNPAGKLTNRPTKYSTKSLAYPADVEGDDMQGHYIIFEILTQNKAKIVKESGSAKVDQTVRTVTGEADPKSDEGKKRIAAAKKETSEKVKTGMNSKKFSYAGGKSNSIQLSQGATTKIDTQIALYMPPSISVSYNSKYGEQEIGVLASAGAGIIDAFAGKSGADMGTAIRKSLDEAGKGAETAVMKILDTAAPGATALTRMFGANSAANVHVKEFVPALAAP